MQLECDQALDSGDIDKSLKLSEICFNLGHEEELDTMIKASYLYCSATSLMDILPKNENIELKSKLMNGVFIYIEQQKIYVC